MDIAVENLPGYESISCEPIREAAGSLSAAKTAQDEAKKALVEAEQTLPSSQWKDAEAAEAARAEGKPEPKTRSHTAAHEKQIADLEHEQRVAELALTRARDVLEAALGEHGQAWADELTTSIESMSAEWRSATDALIGLYTRLNTALRIASRVVGIADLPKVGVLRFGARSINDLEIAPGQRDPHGVIDTGEVLAALAGAIEVEPVLEKRRPNQHANVRVESPNRSMGVVENEIRERHAFDEHMQSPEAITERERVVAERQERRRQRAERNRQAAKEAEQTEAGEQTVVVG